MLKFFSSYVNELWVPQWRWLGAHWKGYTLMCAAIFAIVYGAMWFIENYYRISAKIKSIFGRRDQEEEAR